MNSYASPPEHSASAPHSTPALQSASAQPTAFMTFGMGGTRYGVEALAVREVVPRPALAALAGASAPCVGLLDLRGNAVPVLDVSALLGGAAQPPRATDHIIVVQGVEGRTGLLVGEVYDVRSIAPADVQTIPRAARPLASGQGRVEGDFSTVPLNGTEASSESVPNNEMTPDSATSAVFHGLARLDDGLVLLLHLPALLAGTTAAGASARRAAEGSSHEMAEGDAAILRARAATLRQVPGDADVGGASLAGGIVPTDSGVGVAVVTLGGEAFGLALDSVREFCRVGVVTPVPCCPPHVLGQMNLRGDLLTLLDLRAPLGLAPRTFLSPPKPDASTTPPASEMAVVVEVGGIRAGVVVEDVREVTHLRETTAWPPLPHARDANAAPATPHLPWGGTLPWGDSALNLLDLAQFLARPELVVREEV